MICFPCFLGIYAIIVLTYILKLVYIHVGVYCVYELILIYLSAFVVTIIAYVLINFMKKILKYRLLKRD